MATKTNRKAPQHEKFRRTISEELFQQWRNLSRKGDPIELMKVLGVSKPTINKALIYGCCHQQSVIDGITKYFADRILKEKADAENLRSLQNDANDVKSTTAS